MWEILEVLRRVGRGESKSAVARTTGRSRMTVRRYVRTAVELGWDLGAEEPSEELAAQVYARHRPASERSPGEAEARLLGHRDQIKQWLKPGPTEKRGLRLTKVHELLRRRNVQVPYSTLYRFAVKHCGFSDRRRVTVRKADCEPGELAEVDFGRLGPLRIVAGLQVRQHLPPQFAHQSLLCWVVFGQRVVRMFSSRVYASIASMMSAQR